MEKKMYRVTFNHNLHSPIIVEAESELDAKNLGLAAYRKRCILVDNFSREFVVENAIEITQ